ncbi:MAG: hypothetical protein AB7I30_11770 [Isosphaeraceae bacterium]
MSRVDLEVDNEATGFMIASEGLHGRDFSSVDSEDEEWLKAVKDGVFLPFELVQDDSFIIRVVVDEPLSSQEEAEWVGRTRHKLRVPDGRLVIIGGGPEYLWGEDVEEFTRFLDVPPGDYLAELHTYYHGINGSHCLNEAEPSEPIGSYFRRTRPGEAFPLWLRNECASDPEADPGREEEWRGVESDYETEQPPYVGFLLRLSPLERAPKSPPMEDGWFEIGTGARRPKTCPIGIVADHLVPREWD